MSSSSMPKSLNWVLAVVFCLLLVTSAVNAAAIRNSTFCSTSTSCETTAVQSVAISGTYTTHTLATSQSQQSQTTSCLSTQTILPTSASHNSEPFVDWKHISSRHPVSSIISLPTCQPNHLLRIQKDFNPIPEGPYWARSSTIRSQRERRESVKNRFLMSWNNYKQNAWGRDEFNPISGRSNNRWGGWGATLVDSLDTLWIMDLKDEFQDAALEAAKIDFNPTYCSTVTLNMFETRVRFLGGILAAHDLVGDEDKRQSLFLEKAIEVGDMILASFDTPNRMPITNWHPRKAAAGQEQLPTDNDRLAEMASASLELTRLSQITGDMRYYDAAARVTNILVEQQERTKIPGLFPSNVNVRDADFTEGNDFSLGAMSDVAYEYFAKTWQLLGGRVSKYAQLYERAMDAAIKHLVFRPMHPDGDDILASGIAHADRNLEPIVDHASCFAGSMFLHGGRLFGNDTLFNIGNKLTSGCVSMYQGTASGIMPERFTLRACPSWDQCAFRPQRFPQDDWTTSMRRFWTSVEDPRYLLRPEAVESLFYLYRTTGDPRLPDLAWEMFVAVNDHTQIGDKGNAAIKSVMENASERQDVFDSVWMAETMKYFYLIFNQPEVMSLDEWVFNTRGHPFKIPSQDVPQECRTFSHGKRPQDVEPTEPVIYVGPGTKTGLDGDWPEDG